MKLCSRNVSICKKGIILRPKKERKVSMNMNEDYTKGLIKKIRGLIIFTAVIIVCFWNQEMVVGFLSGAFNIIFPFVLGGAIAFIINVPMSFIERHLFRNKYVSKKLADKIARPASLCLTLIFIISIICVVFFVVVPQLAVTIQSLGNSIQVFIPQLAGFAGKIFKDNPEIAEFIMSLEYDWNKIVSMALKFVQTGADSVFDTTVTVARGVFSAMTTFFISFVFSVYIVLQKEILSVQMKKVLFAFVRKGRAEATIEVLALAHKTFSSFLTGQCVEAVILGTMFVITLTIFKIPFALLIGVLIAFTALIPVFGAFLGCAVGSILIFIDDPIKAIYFIIIFLVLQQIEGNLIYPYVVGNSIGLPAIWVLAAVSVGGSLMGIVGMLIFIPLTSVAYALFREVVHLKLIKNRIDLKDIR